MLRTIARPLTLALLIGTLVVASAVPFTASAQSPIWNGRYNVSCNVGGAPCTFCDLLKVGANIVDFIALFIIPVVTIMVVYGGFLVMTTGSSPARATKGWEAIRNAVFGFIITLGAWVIVNTVFSILSGGSGLRAIQCPTSDTFNKVPFNPASANCDSLRLTVSNDVGLGNRARFSAGAIGQFGLVPGCDAGKVNANLQTIQHELTTWLVPPRFQSGLYNIIAESAFRPRSYQAHLREVFDKYDLLEKNRATLDRCDEARVVDAEMRRHGLGSHVANPGLSLHEKGSAVDLIINGCGNGNFGPGCAAIYTEIDRILQSTEGGHRPALHWRRLGGDEVHFELLDGVQQNNTGC